MVAGENISRANLSDKIFSSIIFPDKIFTDKIYSDKIYPSKYSLMVGPLSSCVSKYAFISLFAHIFLIYSQI